MKILKENLARKFGMRKRRTIVWRKVTAIVMCLLLTIGHIQVASAALSDQVMANITGLGLDEVSSVLQQSEFDIVDSETNWAKPALPDMPASEVSATESSVKEELPITEELPPLEEPALIDIKPFEEDALSTDPTEPIPCDTETEQIQQEQTTEVIEPIAEGMVLQSTAYTCGPAALATLLKMIGGGDSYYQQIIEIAQTDQTGTSMLGLKQAAEKLGYEAAGYSLDIKDLATSGPVVAHVVINGYHHFTVLEGMVDGLVYLADPTLGYLTLPIEKFMASWSGTVLKVSGTKPVEGAMIVHQNDLPISISIEEQTYKHETLPADMVDDAQQDEIVQFPAVQELLKAQLREKDKLLLSLGSLSNETTQVFHCTTISNNQGEPLPLVQGVAENAISSEVFETEASSTEQTGMHIQMEQLDKYTGRGLAEDILAYETENPKERIESHLQVQFTPSRRLDEAGMEQIRGRAIFLAPLVVKAAIKLAPVVATKVVAATHSHHIVAKNAFRAAPAQAVLRKFGVGINDAVNRVAMPAKVHARIHTKAYYTAVNMALRDVRTIQGLNNTLRDIARSLQSGGFPR